MGNPPTAPMSEQAPGAPSQQNNVAQMLQQLQKLFQAAQQAKGGQAPGQPPPGTQLSQGKSVPGAASAPIGTSGPVPFTGMPSSGQESVGVTGRGAKNAGLVAFGNSLS